MSLKIILKYQTHQTDDLSSKFDRKLEEKIQNPLNAIVLDSFQPTQNEESFRIFLSDKFALFFFHSNHVEHLIDNIIDVGLQMQDNEIKAVVPFSSMVEEIMWLKQRMFFLQTLKQLSLLKTVPYFKSEFERGFWENQCKMALDVVYNANIDRIFETLKYHFFTNAELKKSTQFNVITNFVYLLTTLKSSIRKEHYNVRL